MASILRLRKLCYVEPVKCSPLGFESFESPKSEKEPFEPPKIEILEKQLVDEIVVLDKQKRKKPKRGPREWRCVDYCCWIIGYLCTTWWLLLLLYHSLPANLPGLKVAEPPGVRLKREGVTALHPLVLVPGIVTGGLELWEGKPCSEGLFRKRLWGGSFSEIFKRYEIALLIHLVLLWL